MSTRATRNNRIAGLFVILATLGALVTLTLVGGGLERIGKKTIVATFEIESGAASLAPGSAVTLGGLGIGTVTSVKHADTFDAILVRMLIDRDVPLMSDASPFLIAPLLGGSGTLNFKSLTKLEEDEKKENGNGDDATAVASADDTPAPEPVLATADTVLVGKSGGNPFLQDVDLGEMVADLDLGSALGDFNVYSIFDTTKENPDGVLGEVDKAIKSFTKTSELAQKELPKVSEPVAAAASQIKTITANADQWRTDIDTILTKVAEASKVAPERLEQIGNILEQAERVATPSNVDRLNDSIENFEATTDDLRFFANDLADGEINERLNALLDSGNEAMMHAEAAISKFRFESDDILADLTLTAIQLRDAAIEVRRSPWRLVYRPTADELNYEVLYDAVRMYANAVTELRSTSSELESLRESLDDRQNLDEEDRARLSAVIERAQGATDRYRDAEDTFIRLLQGDSETPAEE